MYLIFQVNSFNYEMGGLNVVWYESYFIIYLTDNSTMLLADNFL